jgi:hypothetical protein
LEEQLRKDAGRYKKMYFRGKPVPMMTNSSTFKSQAYQNQNQSTLKFEALRPIYTKEIRFSKPEEVA